METIQVDATNRTPKVVFDFSKNIFILSGESYPENVTEFFGALIKKMTDHLNVVQNADVSFEFSFIYFNSSTAKVIMHLFELLEKAAQRGNRVVVNWHYEEGDDNMQEMGEEFSRDLDVARFNLVEKPE